MVTGRNSNGVNIAIDGAKLLTVLYNSDGAILVELCIQESVVHFVSWRGNLVGFDSVQDIANL